MNTQAEQRIRGATYAISDTGPLISAFQSESFDLLTRIFPAIFVSMACMTELEEHGWEEEIRAAGSRILPAAFTDEEQQQALTFAEQIARHSATHTIQTNRRTFDCINANT